MKLIPKFLRPYPTLRLFGRPVRADDMKAVDPIPVDRVVEIERPGFVFDVDPEPAHPDVVVLRVVATEPEANVYRPVCSHEGLNEWGPPPSLEQTAADIRAITIPAMTIAEIVGLTHIHPMLRQIAAVRNGTAKRDSRGRFLSANRRTEGETR